MVEIVAFPRQVPPREAAIERLAVRLIGHFSAVFYQRRILADLPLAELIDRMRENMLNDGHDYDPAVLDCLFDDPAYLARVEKFLLKALVSNGYLPADFR